MKQFLAPVLVLSMFSPATVGCAEKSTTTNETEVTMPGRTTTVIDQQHDGFHGQQQNRSKDEKPFGPNGQQQDAASNGQRQSGSKDQQQSASKDQQQSGTKDQQQSGTKDQQQSGSKDQQQDGSKDQQQGGSRDQKQGTPQNQPPDDSTKKEK
jgi:hypothetical protein